MFKVLFNESIVSKSAISINIEDRSYQFGDGIYEVIGVYNGKSFKMKEHLDRLLRSAEQLKLPLPYSIRELAEKLEELCSVNNLDNGTIYVQVSRGIAPRVHYFPQPAADPVIVGYTQEMKRPTTIQKDGVACLLTEDIRWLRCDIKTVNLLGNVLAKQEAVENGCYEAILHRNETITEGSSTNLFIVKNRVLHTHPANNYILNGITRQTVLDICNQLNIEVVEEAFSKQQLFEADEAFLTGTFIDIVPVNNVNDTVIGSGAPGPVTRILQSEFNRLIELL